MLNLKDVDKLTWVRIVSLLVILINLVSVSLFDFKLLPFTDDQIYEGVSIILTIIVTVWATWKNNSFTDEAQIVDVRLKELKKRNKE